MKKVTLKELIKKIYVLRNISFNDLIAWKDMQIFLNKWRFRPEIIEK